jgi:hypothetical protein
MLQPSMIKVNQIEFYRIVICYGLDVHQLAGV